MLNSKKKKFQVDKWASKHAQLLFTTSCSHPGIIFFAQDVDFMDQADPFVCDCKKKSGWVRCYYHVQSGFCLKI